MDNLKPYEKIIKEATEGCIMTEFDDGKGGSYPYCILPIESRFEPEFMMAVADGMIDMLNAELGKSTCLTVPEAKAFLVAPLIIARTGLPIVVLKKNRDYKVPGQVIIEQCDHAYKGESTFFATGFRNGDRPLIIDDMISSGLTDIGIIPVLNGRGYHVVGVGSLYERGDGIVKIKDATGYDAKGLVRLEIIEGRPFVPYFWRPK